ncbi:hypothetical protein CHS0354_006892 [Potamilus streckersoni]|uniref:Penicillin-binding protein 2 n=1 Tax=Potamilus streckersoni TaxID=2493646 RepID=A0AAE0WBT8_9BIVA|nr:hypothetical protein CHS0354_006892 [Potamilus streckersoni]
MEEQKISPKEKLSLSRREFLFRGMLTVPFLAGAYRLWDLQIINGEKYSDLAAGNRIRLKLISAPRGFIYDREGEVLATNVPSYNLMLTKEDCPDPHETFRSLSQELGLNLDSMTRVYERKKYTPKFIPFSIAEDISWDQMSYFLTFQYEFPGISLDFISKRFYPYGENASHIIGYMGVIDEDALEKIPENKKWSAQVLGKSGIEKIYNDALIGIDGGLQIEVNSQGRTIRELSYIEPVPGQNIRLTINQKLQNEIEKRFDQFNGSVVATDPRTNEILAMVSNPSYDSNRFSLGISAAEWTSLLKDPSKPLQNKTIQGTYSPGSTFKMLIAYAALASGLIGTDSTYHCNGHYRIYGQTFKCWKPGGHGSVNVIKALEQSCNVFFYNMGNQLGIDNIYKYASLFGLGEKTGVQLLNEISGVIPNPDWKKKIYGQPWFPGETISVSIGQGYVTVTPLQLVNYLNVFINGGTAKEPIIVRPDGAADPANNPAKLPGVSEKLDERWLSVVREGLYQVVNGNAGTARAAASRVVSISGKTGTTQVIGNKTREKLLTKQKELDDKYNDHAWFVGFAPFDKPEFSLAVMIENGLSGKNAALFAREVVDYYFRSIRPRQVMLEEMGFRFDAMSPDIPEIPGKSETPEAYCARIAETKARSVSEFCKTDILIIGADTIVVFENTILGKPETTEENYRMLYLLNGKMHRVMTAVFVIQPGSGEFIRFTKQTFVHFRKHPTEILHRYADSGEGLDKAGGYAIQGKGCFLSERIDGSYKNVVGYPIEDFIEQMLLKRWLY